MAAIVVRISVWLMWCWQWHTRMIHVRLIIAIAIRQWRDTRCVGGHWRLFASTVIADVTIVASIHTTISRCIKELCSLRVMVYMRILRLISSMVTALLGSHYLLILNVFETQCR
ncbi:hypothetical protein BDF22DRAFT_696873 [Syncephalis plumigaleata]|nr:hypothetical protein BDF22DRAFT_696873 [Syncephalis plumigaleata]